MRLKLFLYFVATIPAYGQSINNATVNIIGNTQNIIINQTGADHSANLNLNGNGVSAIISQSGALPQSFSLSVNCGNNCPTSPYIVNQY